MNTREWDIDYRRYVIQLRTMLAHPEGSNPWLQSRQVLDEIVDVYPGREWSMVGLQRGKEFPSPSRQVASTGPARRRSRLRRETP